MTNGDLRDRDDPHERARTDPPRRCAIEQLRLDLAARNDPSAIAMRQFLSARDRAIAKGDIEAHECIDAAAARGKSRSDDTGSERPRAAAPAVP
jgi:hypothetical protein